MLAVRGRGVALVVKQALPRLRVADEWIAPARRTDTEAAALRLARAADPGPRAAGRRQRRGASTSSCCSTRPAGWRNWQAELLDGRPHAAAGAWAGDTLGRLHAATAGDAEVAAAFADYEAFALLRLEPYHEAVMRAPPPPRPALAPLVDELRDARICLVHGDYAPKNILIGRDGAWMLDAEVAHVGNPVFDLAFFLAFPLLTALEKPELAAACSELVVAASRPPTRGRAPALAPPARVARRAHRGDAARAHRRPVAGDVPRAAGRPAGARTRRAAAARARVRPRSGGSVVRMNERRIERVLAFEALDSRGTPTVACVVTLAGGAQACATVPSGASTGRHEAHERRDGGERYGGRGVRGAVAAVNGEIAAKLRGHDAAEQAVVDAALRDLDGTPALSRLGANAVLAASRRVRAGGGRGRPRCRSGACSHPALRPLLPRPMVNVLSGGAHAGRAVDVQDVLVVPLAATTFAEAIEHAALVRAGAAAELRERGYATALVADEGGLAAPLASNEEALEIATRGIERAGVGSRARARRRRDAAARRRRLPARARGPRLDGSRAGARGRRLGAPLPPRLDRGSARRGRLGGLAPRHRPARARTCSCSATTSSRPRPSGSRTASTRASPTPCSSSRTRPARSRTRAPRCELAQREGYATVVSARSGDSEDGWLADLAVGWRSGQIKVGSTQRSERTAKWNRLLRIEAEHPDAELAPWRVAQPRSSTV